MVHKRLRIVSGASDDSGSIFCGNIWGIILMRKYLFFFIFFDSMRKMDISTVSKVWYFLYDSLNFILVIDQMRFVKWFSSIK